MMCIGVKYAQVALFVSNAAVGRAQGRERSSGKGSLGEMN